MEEKVQVDHLILLVGGNPLPNAVAGKLLARSGGTITLLHSGVLSCQARFCPSALKS